MPEIRNISKGRKTLRREVAERSRRNPKSVAIGDVFGNWTAISTDFIGAVPSGRTVAMCQVKCRCGVVAVRTVKELRKKGNIPNPGSFCRACPRQLARTRGKDEQVSSKPVNVIYDFSQTRPLFQKWAFLRLSLSRALCDYYGTDDNDSSMNLYEILSLNQSMTDERLKDEIEEEIMPYMRQLKAGGYLKGVA